MYGLVLISLLMAPSFLFYVVLPLKEKQERKCPDMSGMTLAQRKKAMVEAARQ